MRYGMEQKPLYIRRTGLSADGQAQTGTRLLLGRGGRVVRTVGNCCGLLSRTRFMQQRVL